MTSKQKTLEVSTDVITVDKIEELIKKELDN